MLKNLDQFFELFEAELRTNSELTGYHRFTNSEKMYDFRKAYIKQRMQYVVDSVSKPNSKIWDVGCGFGTTSILLALLGHEVVGTTLEFYYNSIDERIKYWEQFGDLSKLSFAYENIYTQDHKEDEFDYVIAQDTLHHLEPFSDAVHIIYKTLKKGGELIAVEENGDNVINNAKNFKRRGFKRVTTIYDEKLGQDISFGDENTRNLEKWKKEFSVAPFKFIEDSVEYVRYYWPKAYRKHTTEEILEKERKLWKESAWRRKHLFFGLNFRVQK
ncbi:MAG: class I SAM-dependent methyltransferase [Bacteroidota bacterium]